MAKSGFAFWKFVGFFQNILNCGTWRYRGLTVDFKKI